MAFLYILLLLGIAFLILQRQRLFGTEDSIESSKQHLESNSKKSRFFGIFSGNYFNRDEFKQNNENATNMLSCDNCGKYVPQNEMRLVNNKNLCTECQKLK